MEKVFFYFLCFSNQSPSIPGKSHDSLWKVRAWFFFVTGPFSEPPSVKFGATEARTKQRSAVKPIFRRRADAEKNGNRGTTRRVPPTPPPSTTSSSSFDTDAVESRCRHSSSGVGRRHSSFFFRCHRRRRRKNVEMNSGGCEIKRENAERAKSPDQVRHLRFIFSSLLKILSFISFAECILNLSSFISEL